MRHGRKFYVVAAMVCGSIAVAAGQGWYIPEHGDWLKLTISSDPLRQLGNDSALVKQGGRLDMRNSCIEPQ